MPTNDARNPSHSGDRQGTTRGSSHDLPRQSGSRRNSVEQSTRSNTLSPRLDDRNRPEHAEQNNDDNAASVHQRLLSDSPVNGGSLGEREAMPTRLFHALPQPISRWLQDVNSHTQLQMHGLRRQRSHSAHMTGLVGREEEEQAEASALLPTGENRLRTDAPHQSSRRRGNVTPGMTRSSSSGGGSGNNNDIQYMPNRQNLSIDVVLDRFEGNASAQELAPRLDHPEDETSTNPDSHPSTAEEASTGEESSTRNATDQDNDENDDQSAMDELQSLFRRCHHTLPFLGLLLVYFAYQHTTGILVFIIGTIAIMGLDHRVRTQIALKERASLLQLVIIIGMCVIDMFALSCVDGYPNPFRHFTYTLQTDTANKDGGIFWDVIWAVIVNDFVIRLCSLGMKAIVAGIKSERLLCPRKGSRNSVVSSVSSADLSTNSTNTDEANVRDASPESPRPTSTVAFYRRKLCSSKFMADVFTFAYLFMKGLILGKQGKRILSLVRSFVTLGLEYGVYVSEADLIEAGAPDCSICYETMRLPVKLSCTHMFCEECVMEWFDRERSCPLCRASMVSSGQHENEDIKPQYLDGSTSLFPQLL